MAEQAPFAPSPEFNTPLNQLDEFAFRQWLQQNKVPFDVNAPVSDYDMRGYWQALNRGQPMAAASSVNPNDNRPHFTDYYKTPLHKTFSSESQWARPSAPSWINDSQLASPGGRILFDEKGRRGEIARLLMGGQ